MFFLDAQNNKINLWINNQAVPVHTSFVIQFGDSMNVASVAAAITFINSNNNPVAFALSSDQNAPCSVNVNITPTADLLPNTNYILSVNDTAVDCSGTKHIVKTSAAFTTSA